jgi:hypothetical protein
MSIALFLDLTGLFFGLASGFSFSYGVLAMKKESLRIIAGSFYDGGQQQAAELGQQKADFGYGAGFLIISFFLQLLAKLDPVLPQVRWPNHWLGVVVSVAIVGITVVACLPSWRRARSMAVDDAARMNS